MNLLKWLIVIMAFGYLVAVVVVFFSQRSFLFPIPQQLRTAPGAAGFPEAEEHVLTTADGEKVIVWHVPAKPGRAVVLYFPGNGDYLAARVGRLRAVTSDGTGLVALSYRGYAGSTGTPSEQGLLADAGAAYTFTAARYAADRIVVWGFSLGSGVAVAMAADHPLGKVILEAPYTSIVDVAATVFPAMPVRWLARDPFRSDQRVSRVSAPLLIMHGAKDAVIALSFGERLFALAPGPKKFVRFPEGGHDDLDDHGAMEIARAFMDASSFCATTADQC
ncbi:MAG: alpha/beta hydrolase [Bradyrhizobium sp.]